MPMPASYSIAGASRNQQDHAGACTCAFFEKKISAKRSLWTTFAEAVNPKQTDKFDPASATATCYARRYWRRSCSRERPARTRRAGRMQEPVRMGKGFAPNLINTAKNHPFFIQSIFTLSMRADTDRQLGPAGFSRFLPRVSRKLIFMRRLSYGKE